ncbi:hypothetical protein [Streptomyces sp. NK08204]|uniref:hypothetical protein n=1 Tax=Streptomyces sp. NK08204 TaxID=2873260 RepID=UPI001CEC7ABC|nr:hypothetical protein [Streptomyces sp. NK08204]
MAQLTARRVLTAQAVFVTGAALALLIMEIPGIVREIRILRMVGFPSGSRRPR